MTKSNIPVSPGPAIPGEYVVKTPRTRIFVLRYDDSKGRACEEIMNDTRERVNRRVEDLKKQGIEVKLYTRQY